MTSVRNPLVAIPGEDADRTFDAPWQAQAFAIVVALNKAGLFDWNEWVGIFSREIAESSARTGESGNETYYRLWLDALEQIVVKCGLLAPADTNARAQEWRVAYINTPHGQAVELANATCPPTPTREKNPPRTPITISLPVSRN